MSQVSDYTLSNIGFSAFRTELNSILGAINTLNAGTSAPGSVAAGSLWLDTTNATTPTLKFYDGSDQISLCTFNYSANTVNWLDNTVTADLSGDSTPQLGGMLDVNGNHIGDGTLELLKFTETGSAVNEFTIANAATGGAPALSVTGTDTNVDLQLTAKGTGVVKMSGNSINSDVIPGKVEGTDFTDSLLVGHSTTGTLSAASENVGVGIDCLDSITSGDRNVAVGYKAMTDATSTGYNVAIGREALADINHTTGFSTGLGYGSLRLCNASYNIGLGASSGDNITSGSGCVIIGSVDAASATASRQLMITGYDGTTATTWIQGDSDGNVEISTKMNPSLTTTGKALVMGF